MNYKSLIIILSLAMQAGSATAQNYYANTQAGGIYVLVIRGDEGSMTKRFVVRH